LITNPLRPHGVWRQAVHTDAPEIQFASGIHSVNLVVAVLNYIYVFTKAHAQRVVEFLEIMRMKDLQGIGSGDDIFSPFLETRRRFATI